jgi:uncharacterized protein YggE
MDHGILRVSETAKAEIEAVRAFVRVQATSDKLVFGNAAVSASEDLKNAIEEIKRVAGDIEIDTESVSVQTNSGLFTKSSAAHYTVKLTVTDLSALGAILGICSTGKILRVQSVIWDYDEEPAKLDLIKQAVQRAKAKAEAMMDVIGYRVSGIRSCSDSYEVPHLQEITINAPGAEADTMALMRSRALSASVDLGTEFKSKKTITATCTVEFLIQAKSDPTA